MAVAVVDTDAKVAPDALMDNTKIMEILFIGKIPPIEGGESVSGFNHILNLAEQGHKIHVVTNADEVEENFRQMFSNKDFDFFKELLGTNIFINNTTSMKGYFHIPFSNAYFSKLFGIATKTIEDNKIDKIIGWYFEPYSLLSSILGKLYNIEVEIYHAGSDLSRLSNHPNLFQAYKWMTKNVASVFSKPSSVNVLQEKFNVEKGKIKIDKLSKSPKYFNSIIPFHISEYCLLSGNVYNNILKNSNDLLQTINNLNTKKLNNKLITIGIYGKISSNKGNEELLAALETIAKDGYEFNFISISGGTTENLINYYQKIINYKHLSKNTWVLPFIPHWRIPSFIQSCDIVCFLENNFPIKIHRPQIPFEVFSQGTCLLLSKDIFNNLSYKSLLIDKVNFICVDIVNEQTITTQIKFALQNKEKLKVIGGHGKSISYYLNDGAKRCLTMVGQ